MADKITLATLANLQNETTAVSVINSNNAIIQSAFDNNLSRDGTSPNQMGANMDMNSFRILNLPNATTENEPATYGQLVSSGNALIASNVGFTPTGNVTSNNVQSAIAELDTKKAATSSLANVALSGAGTDLITNPVLWTPVLTAVTPGDLNVVYSIQAGQYWQISNHLILVHFTITTSTFTYTTASGLLNITGLPFTSPNTPNFIARGVMNWGGINKAGFSQINLALGINSNIFTLSASGMGQNVTAVNITDCPTAGILNFNAEVLIYI